MSALTIIYETVQSAGAHRESEVAAKSLHNAWAIWDGNVGKRGFVRPRPCGFNPVTKEVMVDGEEVRMTPTEFKILELLMVNKGRVFSIDDIYEKVWKDPAFNAENTVAVHVRRIREKIEINPKDPKYVKVVWGVGYKMEK